MPGTIHCDFERKAAGTVVDAVESTKTPGAAARYIDWPSGSRR